MIKIGAVSLAFLTLFVLTARADKQADRIYEEAIRLHGSAEFEEVFSLYTISPFFTVALTLPSAPFSTRSTGTRDNRVPR